MDRRLPEWAAQGARRQRMSAGQEEGAAAGVTTAGAGGQFSFSSYLRWRLDDSQSGKDC